MFSCATFGFEDVRSMLLCLRNGCKSYPTLIPSSFSCPRKGGCNCKCVRCRWPLTKPQLETEGVYAVQVVLDQAFVLAEP